MPEDGGAVSGDDDDEDADALRIGGVGDVREGGEACVVATPAFEYGDDVAACAGGRRLERKRSRDRRRKYVRKLYDD